MVSFVICYFGNTIDMVSFVISNTVGVVGLDNTIDIVSLIVISSIIGVVD